MAIILSDRAGKLVQLGRELGRGGEGVVSEVQGRADVVAKVYLKAPGPELVAKLSAMPALRTVGLEKLAAWPTEVIYDRGHAVGFLMPRISGYRPAFELYGPKLRLQTFPKADWRFLIRAAANTARAFAAVHEGQQVIGDVNHGNLVIAQDATVRLIDCDSFQIKANGRVLFCEVGVPTHQPPEMQCVKSYAGLLRNENHDLFGLAVLIFQMLCLARHPYSGRWLGAGEPPAMEQAIKQYCYAYSKDQRRTRMAPPPGSLEVEALGPEICGLFEAAFLQQGSIANGRPTPQRWISALDKLASSLKSCATSRSHFFPNQLTNCPWCALENASGVTLFPVTFVASTAGLDGFMVLWHQLEGLPPPPLRDKFPAPPVVNPSANARRLGNLRLSAYGALLFLGALSIWLTRVLSSISDISNTLQICVPFIISAAIVIETMAGRKLRQEIAAHKREWRALRQEWAHDNYSTAHSRLRENLKKNKPAYDSILAERAVCDPKITDEPPCKSND